ncbi:MAG: WD40 repeat domain-containing protein, partial [Anaerolineae bacterium]
MPRGNLLTMTAYQQIGGIMGVGPAIDSVYAGLTSEQQQVARNIFLRLTALGEGVSDTRRRVLRAELYPVGVGTAPVEAVLQALTGEKARLVVADEQTAEVTHEALIQQWGRLRAWLEENREAERVRQRLTEAANEWQSNGRNLGYLYRDARLAQAEEWAKTYGTEMTTLEQAFLTTSLNERERAAREEEARRRRELQQAQALAEEQRRRAEEQTRASKSLRLLLVGLAVVLVVALTAMGLVLWQSNLATARQLVASAQLAINETDYHLATLLAIEANYLAEDEGREIFSQISYQAPYIKSRTLTEHAGFFASIAWSPDGRQLASGSGDDTIILWDTDTGTKLKTLTGHTNSVTSVAWSPDGHRLASSEFADNIIIWDPDTGKKLTTLTGHTAAVVSVAWSPDGHRLASASWDKTIILWNADTGETLTTLIGHTTALVSVAWAPNSRLASVSNDETLIIWDPDTGEKLTTMTGDADSVAMVAYPGSDATVAWSPNGRLAFGSRKPLSPEFFEIVLWDETPGAKLATLTGHTSSVT